MADDLFTHAAEQRLEARAPLAARLRPSSLDEVVGQTKLLGPDGTLRRLVETDRLSSAILWGPAGTGKTTLSRLVAEASSKHFVQLSAVNASVKDVRAVIAEATERLGTRAQGTMLFLDEVHRFNKSQQDALLPAVESGVLTLIGATTENPFFEVNAPLRSRSTLFRLEPLDPDDLEILLRRGLAAERAVGDDDAIAYLASRAAGDGRQALTTLEVAVALAAAEAEANGVDLAAEHPRVTLDHAEAATDLKSLRYGRDEHYDIVSAFIKSIRGSDPDAAIYWLARMLAAEVAPASQGTEAEGSDLSPTGHPESSSEGAISEPSSPGPTETMGSALSEPAMELRDRSEVSEDELIAALRDHGYRIQPTARALRISRTALYALIDACPRVRKAGDLDAEEIRAALADYGGRLPAVADHLGVSLQGLKMRIKDLGERLRAPG